MDNKCKYCKHKNPKTLVATKGDYVSAWVKIYTNENGVRLGISASGESDSSNSVEIYYCPVCGRKLDDK